MITKAQYDFLTRPLDPNRVGHRQGQSHLEAWDVRRHLIRVFGFGGFDIERRDLALVKEIESPPGTITYKNKDGSTRTNDKTAWTVVYRVELRLIIKAPDGTVMAYFDDGATGDGINMPSVGDAHDFALKTAYSQALKRCAVNLGDAFGLSLYNGGRPGAVVLRSLVTPEGITVTTVPADEAPVEPEPTPTSTEPEQPAAAPAAVPDANTVRDWALKPDRTADGVDQALAKLVDQHPQVAATVVVNETGDEEQLQVLLTRRARELSGATPAKASAPAAEPAKPNPMEDRRRKRMHALWNDLGYGGDANRAQRLTVCARLVDREVGSTNDLAYPEEVERVIAALEERQRQQARQPEQSDGPVTPEVARQKREELEGAPA